MEAYGDDLDEEEVEAEVGVAIPATLAILGICFIACALLCWPVCRRCLDSSRKFGILAAMLKHGLGASEVPASIAAWCWSALMTTVGLSATMIAMTRPGSAHSGLRLDDSCSSGAGHRVCPCRLPAAALRRPDHRAARSRHAPTWRQRPKALQNPKELRRRRAVGAARPGFKPMGRPPVSAFCPTRSLGRPIAGHVAAAQPVFARPSHAWQRDRRPRVMGDGGAAAGQAADPAMGQDPCGLVWLVLHRHPPLQHRGRSESSCAPGSRGGRTRAS
jgi:hypothetical protein